MDSQLRVMEQAIGGCDGRMEESLAGRQRLHWEVFSASPAFFLSPESAGFLEADLPREAVCNNTIQTAQGLAGRKSSLSTSH